MVINQKLLYNVIVEFWIGNSVYDYIKYFKFSFIHTSDYSSKVFNNCKLGFFYYLEKYHFDSDEMDYTQYYYFEIVFLGNIN